MVANANMFSPDCISDYEKVGKSVFRDVQHRCLVILRDLAQNTTNRAISLVVYNVIPLLIGPS